MDPSEKSAVLVAQEKPIGDDSTDLSSTSALNTNLVPINDEDDTSMLMTADSSKPTLMVIVLTMLTSISGFMFGYDTGYISSALVAIGDDFGKELTYGQQQLITAATSLGALLTSIFAGTFADVVGRKPVVMFSNILFVIGAVIQCAAQTVWTMISGRFVMGFGVGIGSLIAPLYISELAPSKFRGRLVILNCLGITGGQLIAYGIGAGLDHVNNGWRIVVGLSMIPPVVQLIAFVFLPETPRFLIMKNRIEKAAKVITKTHIGATPELIDIKIQEIQRLNEAIPGDTVLQKLWNSIKEIHMVPSNFRALVIACGLQGIQQFTGFNSLMYFSSTIFKAIGFDNSTAVSIIVSGTNFIMTVVAFFIIDRVGRRRILMFALPVMMAFLVLNAIAFHYVDIKFANGSAIVRSDVSSWGIVIIVAMIGFVASYAVGIGNVPWQQSELFPQSVRGLGASYATATNWSGSLVISATFLTMLENITPTGTFALFAALTFFSIIFVYLCYPELSNLELEETQKILTGGFNIKASKKLAKRRRIAAKDEKFSSEISNEHIDDVKSSLPA
ncbi:hypothetical protein CANARDRAFT_6289 [[Candida] arabinofermentans NRRL YB-2248]|uniref:Major facilitator superfamily (MFS) profile domain-containing protein n=1 Tax=[Candida] arabinofermentans NRRL YB-2248 TaxID=983967 RepID=A0A1E4T4P8_9ASCO|nr:hypothetical protein CANARDRAFT_6289 [[Candida] arabinofermentans NRRL YB-2248]